MRKPFGIGQMLFYSLGIVFLCILLVGNTPPLAATDVAAESLIPDYENKNVELLPSIVNDVRGIANKIKVRLPGAVLLLFLSAFFSSINFLSELNEDGKFGREIWAYLIVWIITNYIFALIILILILPKDADLNIVNKTVFFYCLLASGLPEISSNLRFTLGKTGKSLDLYKYKTRLSSFISQKLDRTIKAKRNRQILSLIACYDGRMNDFRTKLALFREQIDLKDEQVSKIKNIIPESIDSEEKVDTLLLKIINSEPAILPAIVDFFYDDLCIFKHSPKACLMCKLHPDLKIDEAKKFVLAGVTNVSKFLSLGRFAFYRKKIADKTGLSQDRVDELYYSTRGSHRQQRINYLKKATIFLLMITITVSVFGLMDWGRIKEVDVYNYSGMNESFNPEDVKKFFNAKE